MTQHLWAEAYEPLELLEHLREPPAHHPNRRREQHDDLLNTYTRSLRSVLLIRSSSRERHDELLNTYTVRCLVGIGADREADLFREHAFGFTGNDSDELVWAREDLEAQAGLRDRDSSGQQARLHNPLYTSRARATLAAINELASYRSPWCAAIAVTRETQHLIQREQCEWLRCLFPNPSGTSVADSLWLTSTVLQLAQGISTESAFDRLPILADALQDAGCTNEDLLHHCRHDATHGPHCWAVLAVLEACELCP